MNPPLVLGIEIGGTKLQIVSGTPSGDIVDRERFEIIPERGAVGICECIAQALPRFLSPGDVRAIGVGFGGPLHQASGRVAASHQVGGWSDFPLKQWLEELAQLPVVVENDANVAAFAEASLGAGKKVESLFYVTLGSGVGGGFVKQGAIFHGTDPGEAEIGHLRLDKEGRVLEQFCSGWAVDRKVREFALKYPESRLAKLTQGMARGEARVLAKAIQENDSAAADILNETAADLALGLSHVVHLLHPELLLLGGGLALIGEPLRASVDRALHRLVMEIFRPALSVKLSALGEDVVPKGALLLAACHIGLPIHLSRDNNAL